MDAPDLDDVSARAGDLCAHRVEEVGKVHDVGLLRRVFYVGDPVGQDCADHDIHGGADGDDVEIDACAGQSAFRGLRADVAVLELDLGADGLKALDVLIDGTGSEVAAAGKRDLRVAEAAKLGADQIVGRADAANQITRRDGIADVGAVDFNGVGAHAADLRAHLVENLQKQTDIRYIRDVFDAAHAPDQQRSRQNADSGVFRPADGNRSVQGFSPVDHILDHGC